MPSLQSHLSVLEAAASAYSDSPAFRIAQLSASGSTVDAWLPISYRDFLSDVELAARFWFKKLSLEGVAPRSVVGLW